VPGARSVGQVILSITVLSSEASTAVAAAEALVPDLARATEATLIVKAAS
jgi:hypothetical protein